MQRSECSSSAKTFEERLLLVRLEKNITLLEYRIFIGGMQVVIGLLAGNVALVTLCDLLHSARLSGITATRQEHPFETVQFAAQWLKSHKYTFCSRARTTRTQAT